MEIQSGYWLSHWIIESTDRGERQPAYRILVVSMPGLLAKGQGDLWDRIHTPNRQNANICHFNKT
jgi:hypothetical protein